MNQPIPATDYQKNAKKFRGVFLESITNASKTEAAIYQL